MSRVLRLYNSFTKVIEDVKLGGKLIDTREKNAHDIINGSLYICGPTVYSYSHLGHALTYVRADLFRRFMKSIFSIKLTTVMNITDVDDKILSKVNELPECQQEPTTNPDKHPFNFISEKYYQSFLDDMKFIRVQPPDLILKVSNHIPLITRYISHLEKRGHAYITPNGDIYFHTSSIKNYSGLMRQEENLRVNPDEYKKDPRDFALWKSAKPGEPVWIYHSEVTDRVVPGRPGWHVQCSAIASAIFGDQLDFHFGGIDLLFPHHYNEEACCCAFHGLDTSKSTHVWSKHWLHSGHLVLKDYKMSKSIGNVIAIKSFVDESSINALRLLCISTHYRSNVDFNEVLMSRLKSLDHKLSAFANHLNDGLRRIRNEGLTVATEHENGISLHTHLSQTHEDILDGVCDGFDLEKGLNSIIELARIVYSHGLDNLSPKDLVATWQLLSDWCTICGLEYGPMKSSHDDSLIDLIREFRNNVRNSTLMKLKIAKIEKKDVDVQFLNSLLKECDSVRARMDELGFVERDNKLIHLPHTKSDS